jgi:hypothetical protein
MKELNQNPEIEKENVHIATLFFRLISTTHPNNQKLQSVLTATTIFHRTSFKGEKLSWKLLKTIGKDVNARLSLRRMTRRRA